MRPTHAHISLKNLRHNLAEIKARTKGERLIFLLKANAYGHGLIHIAKQLEDHVDAFAVALVEEATQIRHAGIKTPILCLEGFFDEEDLSAITHNHFWTVIHNDMQLDMILTKQARPEKLFIKIDTGMHRLGFQPHRVDKVIDRLNDLIPEDDMVLMTHYGNADLGHDVRNERQAEMIRNILDENIFEASIKNSAFVYNYIDCQNDWTRIGLILYGLSPDNAQSPHPLDLKPVMSLLAPIMSIRTVPEGDAVGYGNQFIATRKTTIATVAIGYGDGYPQHTANGTPTYIKGQIAPTAGQVSMDMLTIDITDLKDIHEGDMVELWGEHISPYEVAAASNSSVYELLSRISPRVRRVYG